MYTPFLVACFLLASGEPDKSQCLFFKDVKSSEPYNTKEECVVRLAEMFTKLDSNNGAFYFFYPRLLEAFPNRTDYEFSVLGHCINSGIEV